MRTLRALGRVLALALSTLGWYLSWGVGSIVLWRSSAARRRWRNRHFRGWSRAQLRRLRIEVTVDGDPPSAPYLLVSNHLSYVDVLVLASCLPDAVFVAKSEVASWPVIGHLANGMGTLFIDRQSRRDIPRVVERIDDRLAGGWGIVLFPEGTSTDGADVGRFKPGLLEAPALARLPVYPAALSYRTGPRDEAARTSICWWGEMGFGPHLWRLAGLEAAEARLSFRSEPIVRADRKELAAALRSEVLALFRPTTREEDLV